METEPEKASEDAYNKKNSLLNLVIRIWRHESDPPSSAIWVFAAFLLVIGGMMMLATGSAKPVIYLYPEYPMDVMVSLDYNGKLRSTYPKYDEGWSVTAYPDGSVVNHADGLEYSYLFWDGDSTMSFDFSSGFVVAGRDTAGFLREKLAYMGLTPREYNEFIVYWLPMMEKNRYNLISFQGTTYTDNAALYITPEPDSVLRVFMAFKPLPYRLEIPPQKLARFERKGFTVVEWGGSEARF